MESRDVHYTARIQARLLTQLLSLPRSTVVALLNFVRVVDGQATAWRQRGLAEYLCHTLLYLHRLCQPRWKKFAVSTEDTSLRIQSDGLGKTDMERRGGV